MSDPVAPALAPVKSIGITLEADTYVPANPATGDRARLVATLPAVAPAGIVREKADDVLDKVHEALDAQIFRNKFLEGEQVARGTLDQKRALLAEIAREVNARLNGAVKIVGAYPESHGFGARFIGVDSDAREYTADLHIDAESRMSNAPEEREREAREIIGLLAGGILKKRAEYLHRMTGT